MRILIADDEALVRRSIRLFLTDMGIEQEFIEEAGDGLEMVEILMEKHVDLAFADIRMPALNGLEAIKKAREKSPLTDFCVLSGFDDFKYAQEAIRLGVKDYLLKPLKREELERILEETISAAEQQKMELIEKLKLYTAAFVNVPETSIQLSVLCHPIMLINDIPQKSLSISELMSVEDDKMIVIPYRKKEKILLFLFEVTGHEGYYNQFLSYLVQSYGDSHTLIEGRPFTDSTAWTADYKRLLALADSRPVYGGCKLYRSSCKAPVLDQDLLRLCKLIQENLTAFSQSDYTGFSISSDELVKTADLLEQKDPAVLKRIQEYIQTAFGLERGSVKTLRSRLSRVLSSMPPSVSSRDFKYEEILAYIKAHYQEDLSLASLASVYHLSPNYFSTLFKKMTGCNFINYVTDLRLKESKRLLLETDLTVGKIAREVGYYSTSFFIRSFKKAEQITPTEYRKKEKNGG